MKFSLELYNNLREKVKFLYGKLRLERHEKTKGRKLAIPIIDTITISLYKQTVNIATKKRLYEMLALLCSYKTLVVNVIRFSRFTAIILALVLKANRRDSHPVKHTDSTDIPVCLTKNARNHKTMNMFSNWGRTGKGWFFGLKLHLTSDLKRKILAIKFTSGNIHDSKVLIKLNKGLYGVFVADAAFCGEELAKGFYREHKRILFAKPRKNMKKIMTWWQDELYSTRMSVELNFRNLKMFYGLVTSLPRSANGYFANYIYSLLAYTLAE